jgi:hypothetical protein
MFSELILTDGTIRINLLAANKQGKGIALKRYIPGRPAYKGGGVWQDSPLATGRQLVAGLRTNTADALTLSIAYPSHNEIILAYEDLDAMLEKAAAYWLTTWQQEPVYLQALAAGENNRRYAVVNYATFDQYFDPYNQPYLFDGNRFATEDFTLGIERGLWLEFPPGEYESIAIAHAGSTPPMSFTCTFDIITGGCENLDPNVLIANMSNRGLQAIYKFTGSFSANLLGEALPYSLMADPPATGNIVYFGSDQPFWGIATDFSEVADPANTLVYEYWDGAAWTAFTPDVISPASFDDTGVAFTKWAISEMPDWTKVSVNSDVYFWVRVRVTSGGTGTTTFTQANRHIYSTTTNYIEVLETAVLGQQDALLRMLLGIYTTGAATTSAEFWMGLRSYERGSSFVAHINLGGNPAGNASGITVGGSSAGSGHTNATVSNQPDQTSPGGGSFSLTGATGDTIATIGGATFDGTIADHYYGRFRMFVLLDSDDNTGASQLRYATYNSASNVVFVRGEIKTVAATPTTYQLVDLGSVSLPPSDVFLASDTTYGFRLVIEGVVTNLKTLTFHSIILIPTDEYMVHVEGEALSQEIQSVLLDGIGYPKYKQRAFSLYGDPYVFIANALTASGGEEPILHAGTRQRYWFLFRDTSDQAPPNMMVSVKMYKTERFLSLRAD